MKKLLIIPVAFLAFACNNSKKEPKPADDNNSSNVQQPADSKPTTDATAPAGSSGVSYTIDGTTISNYASILVTKDKDNLQPGTPLLCMLTSNAAKNNNEYLTLNFLLDTKPGTYPVVGTSFQRGKTPNDEMYGGLLGGTPKLTNYKVTITECKDLGANNMGGHKWSISGTCEEVVIDAMKIMLMDKTKNHPEKVTLTKISFSNLSFDDNWEQMLEEGMKKVKGN